MTRRELVVDRVMIETGGGRTEMPYWSAVELFEVMAILGEPVSVYRMDGRRVCTRSGGLPKKEAGANKS